MKRIVIAGGSLLFAVIAKAQDADQVRLLLDQERYVSAEKLLEKKLNSGETAPEFNYLLVKTYLEQEKQEDAGNFVEQQGLSNPGVNADPMNRVAYGSYLLHKGDINGAGSIFSQVLDDKKNGKNPALLTAIAEAHINAEKGDVRQAISLLEQAGKKDKKNPAIDILQGNAYRRLSDGNNAFLAYQSALEKDPRNVKAHYLTGKIFVTQKNAEVYMDHFMKAYAIDSTYAPVLDELYDHYYFRDVTKARIFLEKFIANSDYATENDYRMTDLLYLTKEYNKAIASANAILQKASGDIQPRLYKLIAYSYEALGDTAKAALSLEQYFTKEDSSRLIAQDYEFRARTTLHNGGPILTAAEYYSKAFTLDSLPANKVEYATKLAGLYKVNKDYSQQAKWLQFIYENKESRSNVDLFYWGLAHYNAQEYPLSDSVFVRYTTEYPENIFGYYWRAQVNAAIDTNMGRGLAIPHYNKVIEMGEKDKTANKTMLLKAYAYLGGYEANITKNYRLSLEWFRKSAETDPSNAEVKKYIELLEKWIAEGK